MNIPLEHFLVLGALMFCLGMIAVVIRKNAIVLFMGIELMLNAVNLTFLAFSRAHGNMNGHIFVFFIIAVAAVEAAVGLAIVLNVYRHRKNINVDEANSLKF